MLPIDAINKLARRAARTNIAIIESAACCITASWKRIASRARMINRVRIPTIVADSFWLSSTGSLDFPKIPPEMTETTGPAIERKRHAGDTSAIHNAFTVFFVKTDVAPRYWRMRFSEIYHPVTVTELYFTLQ